VISLLYAGSLVSCHSFLIFSLCRSSLSKPGGSLFRSKEWILLLTDSKTRQ
jgi:hypothetical protein